MREKLLAAFQIEHREHLEAVRGMLRRFAEASFDPSVFDFDETHRRVHSLKGAARIVGLDAVEALSHRLETLMELAQNGKVRLDRRVAQIIQRALDAIEDCVAQGEAAGGSPEAERALSDIAALLGGGETGGMVERRAAPDPKPVVQTGAETARISIESLDLLLRHARESLSEQALQEEIGRRLRALRSRLAAPDIVLPAESMDDLRDLIRLQSEATWRAKRQAGRIHRDLSALRIMPADGIFGGIRTIIRDLARKDGKEVEIDVEGLDIRADRLILQALKDPVVHLLRNAIGHGIEAPAQRESRGKPRSGFIAFRIRSERNRLVLRIEDDGAGLDPERIVREAAKRGLLPADAPVPDSAEALTRILLTPGFSTEQRVTAMSGRGVGLSVVDRAVGQMQGSFTLAPRAPYGTAATITVPTSVASSQLLLFRCREQSFAMPLHWIERIERIPLDEVIVAEGRPTHAGPDRTVPLARLADLLGFASGDPLEDNLPVVLVRSENGLFGLVVEGFAGLQDALIHDLDAALPGLDLMSGASILSDGTVCPVINPAALLERAGERVTTWPVRNKAAPEKAPAEILIVDDSITTRTLEKSILEARGFRVSLSVDGMDAIEQLRRRPVDLVIADVEMPRMDGFELLHAMKSEQKLAGIPVVLVTSRNDEKDQRKGLALGAEAYIVKQRFDQRELLETVDQIL